MPQPPSYPIPISPEDRKRLAANRAAGKFAQTDFKSSPAPEYSSPLEKAMKTPFKEKLPQGVIAVDSNGNYLIDPDQVVAAVQQGEAVTPNPALKTKHPEVYKTLEELAEARMAAGEPAYEGGLSPEKQDYLDQAEASIARSEGQGMGGQGMTRRDGVAGYNPAAALDLNTFDKYDGRTDSQRQIDQALEAAKPKPWDQKQHWGNFLGGFGQAEHKPYSGGLQSIAGMFQAGASNLQQMKQKQNLRMEVFNRMRVASLENAARMEQQDNHHQDDVRLREQALKQQRNPWMKVDGGLYNWETDSFKKIANPKDRYMKVGDGLYDLNTEEFVQTPNDGTRPEWLPAHFEDVKDYNQTTKSINDEARKDTAKMRTKRENFNVAKAVVDNNPDYSTYTVAEANALVKVLEKMLDPSSAVLAGESDAYKQGAAMLKQARKYVYQAEKGGTQMTEEQIEGLVTTINTVYGAMQDDSQKVHERYNKRYERQKIGEVDRFRFLPMLSPIGFVEPPAPPAPLPPFDPASHGLAPITNKNRSNP